MKLNISIIFQPPVVWKEFLFPLELLKVKGSDEASLFDQEYEQDTAGRD